jgi:hypothetical protein
MPNYVPKIMCIQHCIVALVAQVLKLSVALYRSTAQRDDLKVERKDHDPGLITPQSTCVLSACRCFAPMPEGSIAINEWHASGPSSRVILTLVCVIYNWKFQYTLFHFLSILIYGTYAPQVLTTLRALSVCKFSAGEAAVFVKEYFPNFDVKKGYLQHSS